MSLKKFYQEIYDFQEQNEEMVRLYENYYNTNIYKEIVEFLDIAHPERRKNKELGRTAPEFLLSVIGMWEVHS